MRARLTAEERKCIENYVNGLEEHISNLWDILAEDESPYEYNGKDITEMLLEDTIECIESINSDGIFAKRDIGNFLYDRQQDGE